MAEIKKCFKPIFENKYRYLIYKGGRGSGKSWGIADSLLMVARMQTARILCTRQFQTSIKKSSYKLLTDRIKHYGLTDFKITKESIINVVTGSEFIFSGLSDITGTDESLKSIEGITHCWVEEAHKVSSASWKLLTPSIRGRNSKVIVSYNPDSDTDPVHQEFIVHQKPGTFICHINYLDNKHCPKELVEEAEALKTTKPDEYANIWLGQLRDTSKTAVVKYFSKDNIDERITYNETLPLHISMDFNVDPMMWVISHQTNDKIFVLNEIVIENCTTQDAAEEFIRRYPTHKAEIILNGDASGNYRKTQSKYTDYAIVRNVLVRYGFTVKVEIRRFNPPIQHRIHAFNALIYGNDGIRRWFCHPRCQRLIYNLKNLKYKEGTGIIDLPSSSKILADPDLKFLGHIFDAASYQVEFYHPIIVESK